MSRKFNYLVLGAGRQGAALAYDLAKNCDAARVVLADVNSVVAQQAAARVRGLVSDTSVVIEAVSCDVAAAESVRALLAGIHVVLSAVPYRFNEALTRVAVAGGASFCDLGGNTRVVRAQLAMHEEARRAGVSVVPDCGLAPGLGNILAAHGVGQLTGDIDVHVRCGGLPEQPVGPLGYKLVFNFEGLVNEYSGMGEFLREGKRLDVPTLTELEAIEFERPDGKGGWRSERYEAAVTSGGTSTCAGSFAGRVRTYDYKTVRYPGHFAAVRSMFGLGLFEERVALKDGRVLQPRAMTRALFEDRLEFPEVRDIVFLRADISGRRPESGTHVTLRYDLFDRHDEATGFTAMERTTAYPTALVAHLQARGEIGTGARPLEQCLPTDVYMRELGRHDIHVRESVV